MTPLTILVAIYSPFASWNIPEAHVERLRREFPHDTFLHATSDAAALELVPAAHVVFMSELRPAQFAAARSLAWVHSPAAGVGGMLFPDLVASPVVISNSRGISGETIAEHVLALTLAMFRKLPLAVRSQAVRQWAQDAIVEPPRIRMLAGARVLVIGLGSIGGATARKMSALGAHVTGIRRDAGRGAPEGVSAVVPRERLHDALGDAEVVVLAAPQTAATRGLIAEAELAAMRPDALLINVSRGKLVDEQALAVALGATGRPPAIGGAALDVFDHEPLAPESPLWGLPNVLITPHMSGFRPDHWDAVTDLFAENLRRYEAGQPIMNVVDKEQGY